MAPSNMVYVTITAVWADRPATTSHRPNVRFCSFLSRLCVQPLTPSYIIPHQTHIFLPPRNRWHGWMDLGVLKASQMSHCRDFADALISLVWVISSPRLFEKVNAGVRVRVLRRSEITQNEAVKLAVRSGRRSRPVPSHKDVIVAQLVQIYEAWFIRP